MDVKMLSKEKDKVTFLISNTTPAFVNMLRRTIMEDVPTMAISEVELRQNSSALYDEMVAHRLGLLPLKTDLKAYNIKEECTCEGEGCAKCEVKMTLKVEGEKSVYGSDLQSNDPAIVPVFPGMVIVKLLKEQELELEATATLGRGKDHTKWSPGLAYYRNAPVVDIKGAEKCTEAKDVCPVNVFDVKSGKLSLKNEQDCILCGACLDKCENIKLNVNNKDFIFTIEPWGQLDAQDIMEKASEIINKQFDEFAKLL